MSTVRDRIMAALRGSGRPMSQRAIGMRMGYENEPGWLRVRLEALVEEGCLATCNGCAACGNGRKYTIKAA